MLSQKKKKIDITPEQVEMVNNFFAYAPKNLKIQTEDKQLIDFSFNEIQQILHSIIEDIKSQKRLVRLVILKARREGVTTYFTGKFYHSETHNFNRYGYIITHEPDATDFVFDMVKRYYNNCVWRPETKYNNKKILQFNNNNGTGLDSAIRVATAGKEDIGSAQLVHDLLLSELAKYPATTVSELLTSILQCVPDDPDTTVVMESTAKGIGGEFYDRFWGARYRYEVYLTPDGKPDFRCTINEDVDENNIYSSIFFPWFAFQKYRMEVPKDFTRTTDEERLVKLHNLTDEHLQWRRWAIQNKCGGKVDTFQQEYPANPTEAFLSSGRPVFDNDKVIALKQAAPKPKIRYECMISTGQFIPEKDGRLKVWREPITGRSYVISADVAEGLVHGDFNSADVWDQLTGEQVAHWHGHLAPDLFGFVLEFLGRRYNQAWLVIERNNHGLTTITKLQDRKYPRLYVERVIDPPNKPRMRYGWMTTKRTKPAIIDALSSEIRDNTHGIVCAETFDEMLSFQHNDDGTMSSPDSKHDDRVMSASIGKYVRTRLPMFRPTNAVNNYDTPSVSNSRNSVQIPAGVV